MKKLILLLALLLPGLANAMKIVTDEIDEFSGERVVITSWESIDKGYIHVRFRHQSGSTMLDLKYISESAVVISKDANLMFKSTTDSIAKFKSLSIYSGGIGDGAVGLAGSAAWGIYASYDGPVNWFTNNVTRLMRLYMTDGYRDFKLSEKDGLALRKLAMMIYGALNNDNSTKLISCDLQYIKKAKYKKSWDVVKDEHLEDVLPEEMLLKVNEWKSQSDDKYDYDVRIDKKRNR